MTKNIKLFLTTTNTACILMKKIKVSNKKKKLTVELHLPLLLLSVNMLLCADFITRLSFAFLFCKMGLTLSPSQGCVRI